MNMSSKNKNLKKVISVLMMLIFVISSGVFSFADTTDKTTDIELEGIHLKIPFKESDISVEYNETSDEAEVEIYDKKTNELLATYGVIKELIQTRGVYTQKTIYEQEIAGPTVSRLYTRLLIYNDGSFAQIESVSDTWWAEESSGNWELDNMSASTISITNSFPTNEIETSGNATPTVETAYSATGSFSVSALEAVGFEVTGTSGTTVYMRLNPPLYSGYSYSIYGVE